jgi:maltoporin
MDPTFAPTSTRFDFIMYGRMGIGWSPTGQVIAGQYMNLGDRRAIGGRLEEGDYLQPGLRFHLLRGDRQGDTKVDLVMDVEIFSADGSIVSDLANDWKLITLAPEQAYVQVHNLFHVEGLDLWMGARLYRKNILYIADYFYFNNLPAQGVGVLYKGLDAAVLVNTGSSPFFVTQLEQSATPPPGPAVVKRLRTMIVAQYSRPLGHGSSFVQGLGEFHVVGKSRDAVAAAPPHDNPTDFGWVLGVKLHLDLGGDRFNDASFRYGGGIANGAASGRSTFDTFGSPASDGTYRGAYGIEAVDHFLWNVGKRLTLNGYATLHYDRGARDYMPLALSPSPPDTRLDFAVGLRSIIYVVDQFQMLAEATFQGRQDQALPMGTVLKLSVAPTVVPAGERGSYWSPPFFRFIYTFGYYNQAAVDQLLSPFLATVGPTRFAHFLGARVEWWIY